MRIHGLHNIDKLKLFKNKHINEVIILLEEMLRNEKLNDKVQFYEEKLNAFRGDRP